MIDLALLLLFVAMGAAVLWPYWQIARGHFVIAPAIARIVLREVQTLEAREPLYFLRGEVLESSAGPRIFSVFPWHSDNVFRTVEAAQEACRVAGIQDELAHSIVLVRGIFGTQVHASARMSDSARRQLRIWTVVACAVPAAILGVWLQ